MHDRATSGERSGSFQLPLSVFSVLAFLLNLSTTQRLHFFFSVSTFLLNISTPQPLNLSDAFGKTCAADGCSMKHSGNATRSCRAARRRFHAENFLVVAVRFAANAHSAAPFYFLRSPFSFPHPCPFRPV